MGTKPSCRNTMFFSGTIALSNVSRFTILDLRVTIRQLLEFQLVESNFKSKLISTAYLRTISFSYFEVDTLGGVPGIF
jgi:hypothetical protein